MKIFLILSVVGIAIGTIRRDKMEKRKLTPMEELIKDEIEPDVTNTSTEVTGLLGILPMTVGVTLIIYRVVQIIGNGQPIQTELPWFVLGLLLTGVGGYLFFSKR